MNETAKNTKDAKERIADFCFPWRTWRLGGSNCLVLLNSTAREQSRMKWRSAFIVASVLCLTTRAVAQEPLAALRVGRAGHAFDHLGGFAEQAEAAAASGATIIYATGLGGVGYSGLPPAAEFEAQRAATAKYNRDAKNRGIELAIGYICA